MPLKIISSYQELVDFVSGNGFSVLLVATTSCGPCRRFTPVVENASDDRMFSNVRFAKVYLDEMPECNEVIGVGSVPTLILFNNGKEIHREIGFFDLDKMLSLLKSKFL